MSDETLNDPTESAEKPLDLDALSSLNFGPAWADDTSGSASSSRSKNRKGDRQSSHEKKKATGSRDRRPPRVSRDSGSSSIDGHRSGNRTMGRHGRHQIVNGRRQNTNHAGNVFEPTVNIDLYPQDEAFDALVKRLQSTARTYQLFEISKLLLEKYERLIVVVSPKEKGEALPKLYYSVPGHLPFETEDAAVNHVLANHLDLFFELDKVEVDPPKGNFQMVNRCPFTQELLGPPNYHRYPEFLQQHFANRITGMSMERYLEKIETVKDQEIIDAWVNSMKESIRYTVKDPVEGEPKVLETLEAARLFLLQYRKAAVVGSGESVRFAGRDLERMPAGDIRRSVETYVEKQRHFPLETANNIRGRLRRHNFTIYKKGSKNASFVCAVKRKFRDSNSVFTESIQGLIDFIEKHPEIKASELAHTYLGIQMPEKQLGQLKLSEKVTEKGEESSAEKSEIENNDEQLAKAPESDNAEATVEADSAEKAIPLDDAREALVLSEDEESALRQLRMDLRWLVTEGYVTEYGDGRLFAPLAMPSTKPKAKASQSEAMNETTESEDCATPLESLAKVNEAANASSGSQSSTEDPDLNEGDTAVLHETNVPSASLADTEESSKSREVDVDVEGELKDQPAQ